MLSTRASTIATAPLKNTSAIGKPASASPITARKHSPPIQAFELSFGSLTKGVATIKSVLAYNAPIRCQML
jgi:hypothetical protein